MSPWITSAFLRYVRASARLLVILRSSDSERAGREREPRNCDRLPREHSSKTWKVSWVVQNADSIETMLGWWSAWWRVVVDVSWCFADVDDEGGIRTCIKFRYLKYARHADCLTFLSASWRFLKRPLLQITRYIVDSSALRSFSKISYACKMTFMTRRRGTGSWQHLKAIRNRISNSWSQRGHNEWTK